MPFPASGLCLERHRTAATARRSPCLAVAVVFIMAPTCALVNLGLCIN
jgi:hypothetical protein